MASADKRKQIFTIPNLLSMFRLLLIPVIAWLYCEEENYPLTAGALVLSGVTDVVDGFVARRFDMVSDLGKVLDPVADKLTQTVALGCLLLRFHSLRWLLGVLVVKETIMAVMGILVIRRTGAVHSAAWHGKLATCILYAVIFTHIVWYNIPLSMSELLTAAGAAGVVLSLALYMIQYIKRLHETA